MVYNHLGVTEKEYFGLQHDDDSVDSPVSAIFKKCAELLHGLLYILCFLVQQRWLEASKPIRKQLKGWCDLFISVEH